MAQTNRDISGVVKDSTGTSIIAATVKFIAGKDTIFTRTDIDGKFASNPTITNIVGTTLTVNQNATANGIQAFFAASTPSGT